MHIEYHSTALAEASHFPLKKKNHFVLSIAPEHDLGPAHKTKTHKRIWGWSTLVEHSETAI